MLNFPGLKIIAQIYESANSLVYRAIGETDNQRLILKILKANYPTPQELARYRTEYQITKSLNLPGVIKVYDLQKYQNTLAMFLEDFGGESLKNWSQQHPVTLLEFLPIAIQATEILGQIHAANIIHKDINPSNIIFNHSTGQVKIIDFGISTQLTRENPTLKNPNVLEGTLAYISPEQTGRMNRPLDYRTDFYSLGITFYELLTNQLPFAANDALELVHSHIAKQPLSPRELNPDIPQVIAEIVMKLMAKNAEQRYQSAFGIQADLEECWRQLQTHRNISNFPLGSQDISDKFQIPQKLYGREVEIETLLAAFERVSSSQSELMLISGYSGIGKSALVQEIYQPITKKRGYFIAGKFDQYQRNIPYSALVIAFQQLVKQLLAEPENKLQEWKAKLLEVLGINGQIIIDIIPEVQLIIGPQPELLEVGGTESQNRFKLVFQNFIKVFTNPKNPLALFLDDLQWADSASLELIKILMTNDVTGLFLMGAYRDHEVSAVHPLLLTLGEMTKAGVIISKITLSPLDLKTITEILTDTLKCTTEKAQPLAELVQQKTGGNPFFMNEFLKSLYTENFLHFEYLPSTKEGYWQWDLEKIKARGFTDNVLELMTDKIKKLPINTQNSLKVAASIGNQFDLKLLALYWEKPPRLIADDLYEAVNLGLIVPLINKGDLDLALIEEEVTSPENNHSNPSESLLIEYKFIHDRVQQAAYALIDEREIKLIHLRMGNLLQNQCITHEEKIFDLVQHLNLAQELIINEQQKTELAALNLIAARKAKESTAYAAAKEYLITGINLLSGDFWQEHYELAINLHQEWAEIEYLTSNFEVADTLINQTIERCKTNLEKAELYNILIIMLTMMSKYEEAVMISRKALNLFNISFAETDLENALQLELSEVKKLWESRDIPSLLEQPEMTNLEMKAALTLLVSVDPAAYLSNASLYGIIAAKMASLSIKYGIIAASAKGYTSYGIILSSVLQEYEAGYQFACLGFKIAQRFNDSSMKAKACNNLANLVQHWVRPMKEAESINNEGYQAGLESGELQFAGYIALHQMVNFFVSGKLFSEILLTLNDYLKFTDKTKNLLAYHSIIACQLPIYNLSGLTASPFDFANDFLTENEYIEECRQNFNLFALCNYLTYKAQILYLYGNYHQALSCILEAQTMLPYLQGMITLAVNNFYTSLILIALCPTVTASEKIAYLRQIETHQKQMKIWSDNCPENFLHKYLLVEAELARDAGNILEASNLYDRAIENARLNDYIQEEALGNELALKFYLSWDKPQFAQLYLNKAIYCYTHWGALAKVADLEQHFSQLIEPQSSRNISLNKSTITNTVTNPYRTTGEILDLSTVIKASQAISGEIILDKLLAALMKILMENAGAQTGYLIRYHQGELLIEAAAAINSSEVTIQRSTPIHNCQLLSESIVNYVARTQESLVLNDATQAGEFTNDPYVVQHQPKSILCIPLINQNKLVSIVYLENNLTAGVFTPDRLEVLKLLSSQAAISLESANLYTQLEESNRTLEQKVKERTLELANANQEIMLLNERLKAENMRMSAELDVTRKLQQMILPKEAELSQIEGLEIAGFMEPAAEVGGDYYDVLPSQVGKVKIGIGDVTGHGLESGMLMIMAQTAVRTLLESNETNPVNFLDILNRTLYKNISRMNSQKNMTLALLDYSHGSVTISGQHEEVIVVRADGKMELIDTIELGFPVALHSDITDCIAQVQVQLHSGDGVVLYTDGITEAINLAKKQYGLERLCEVIRNSWHKSVREIRQDVIEDVRGYIGAQKVYDDITLVVLKQK